MGIWVLAPGTGWSGTDLSRTNVVVDCGARYADPGDSRSLPGVGESLGTEEGSSPATERHPERRGESGDPRDPTCVMEDSLREEPRILVSGTNVVRSDRGEPQERGSVCAARTFLRGYCPR